MPIFDTWNRPLRSPLLKFRILRDPLCDSLVWTVVSWSLSEDKDVVIVVVLHNVWLTFPWCLDNLLLMDH